MSVVSLEYSSVQIVTAQSFLEIAKSQNDANRSKISRNQDQILPEYRKDIENTIKRIHCCLGLYEGRIV